MPFPTLVTIVLHMATAAFPALFGDCLIVIRHLVQLKIFAYFITESQWLSEQMTGFIVSLVGSNRREEDFFYFLFFHINILHHASGQKRIQTSIIKTFNNEKGCRDDKQKKGKNKVG